MASFASVNDHAADQEEVVIKKPTYKSFKKKYLKIRHTFKDRMRQSNSLFDEEQRLLRLARRLQEQNDQLLDLLLDVNDSSKAPSFLRYDLRSRQPSPSESTAQTDEDSRMHPWEIFEAQNALEEARMEFRGGLIREEEFADCERELSQRINRLRSLTVLERVNHSTLIGDKAVPSDMIPTEISEASPAGYLSPTHEDEYLSTLDAYLEAADTESAPLPPRPQPSEREKEREAQLHNPMSVYNWLSKHRHDVFMDQTDDHLPLQPHSGTSAKERPSKSTSSALGGTPHNTHSSNNNNNSNRKANSPKPPPAPTRSTKRERASTSNVKQELLLEEMLDEDGFVIGGVGVPELPEGRKRKRGKEDEPYRPKGGSSRPSKRKRASTGPNKVDGGNGSRRVSDVIMDDE